MSEETRWGYSGNTGPDAWGDLGPAYRACSLGRRQSPVDIRETVPSALPPLEPAYAPVPVHLFDTGHSIQQTARESRQRQIFRRSATAD